MYPPRSDAALDPQEVANVAAAFQEAIVDVLVGRSLEATKHYRAKGIVLGGGVAANTLLREELAERSPVQVVVPRPALCTDNGAMIGAAAYFHFRHGMKSQWDLDVVPNLRLG